MLKCRSGPQDELTAEKAMALGERSAGQHLEVHLDVGGQEMMSSEGRVARGAMRHGAGKAVLSCLVSSVDYSRTVSKRTEHL